MIKKILKKILTIFKFFVKISISIFLFLKNLKDKKNKKLVLNEKSPNKMN